jgi:hypothetical protein
MVHIRTPGDEAVLLIMCAARIIEVLGRPTLVPAATTSPMRLEP